MPASSSKQIDWARVRELFHRAAELPPPDQTPFLDAAGADETLRCEVLALLAQDRADDTFLDAGLPGAANSFFQNSGADFLNARYDFSPYRLLRLLGEGGMGLVFLAERVDLHNLVAIKVLRDAPLSPLRLQRFRNEQRVLAQLNHPSIGRLYDASTLPDGTPYFVMEYIEGLPLTEHCRRHNCSLKTRLQLFRDVCGAVQFAHAHALIHRDLKPPNILVTSAGEVRLLDFGIAKEIAPGVADQTVTGLRMMTPAYAAPEQVRGDQTGIRTDVYSLGVILYELLAGQLPFDLSSRTPGEAEAILLTVEPTRPSAVRARNAAAAKASVAPPADDWSQAIAAHDWNDLDVLCQAAMRKDPERRYPSVEALVRDLDHFLNAEPLEARPDRFTYRTRKFLRRNAKSVTAAALVSAAVLALTVFFVARLADAKNNALAQAARSGRIKDFMIHLFQGGAEAGPSLDLRAIDVLDRGVQEAQRLGAEPKTQAELFQTLAGSFIYLGKFDRAEPLLQSALRLRTTQFGKTSTPVAESLVALGGLRAEQSKFPEAFTLINRGLAIDRQLLPPTHPDLGRDYFYLGRAQVESGGNAEAVKTLNSAISILARPDAPQATLALALSDLSTAQFNLGDRAAAASTSQRCLALERKIFAPSNPLIAEQLAMLGSVHFQEERFAEAEPFYRSALTAYRSWYGESNPYYATTAFLLAQCLLKLKRYGDAQPLLQQALPAHEKAYGKLSFYVGGDLNALAMLSENTGHWQEAVAYYNRVIEVDSALAASGNHHPFLISLHNLADLNLRHHLYALSEKQSRLALAQAEGSLPPGHLYAGVVRLGLGKVLFAEKRYREAEPYLVDGYAILSKQGNPSMESLLEARKALAAEYKALHRLPEAQRLLSQSVALPR